MSVMDVARELMAETKASGALLVRDPLTNITGMDLDYEAPARWRVGVDTWDALKREAEEIAGPYNVVADTANVTLLGYNVTLLGYPVVVDRIAPPSLITLEPIP